MGGPVRIIGEQVVSALETRFPENIFSFSSNYTLYHIFSGRVMEAMATGVK
jgi:hypothetical protein